MATVDEVKSSERHSCVAGPFGSSISSKFFTSSGVPIIRGSNLTADLDRFVADKFAFISYETAARFSAQTVRAGDLVFTCWGTIGQVGLIPQDGPFDHYVISNKQLKLRVDTDILDPLFAFYFFAAPETVQYVRDRAIGSAVPGINLGILKALPVLAPPLNTQRRIASILGAYDDLIEVNRRRVSVLEEMARGLFEEWFVRFRFPGHENVPIVDTPDGPLPEGWRWGRAKDLVDFDPKTKVPKDGDKPFVPMGQLDTTSSLIAPFEVRSGNSGAKFQNGDTLFARITPCLENGKTGIVRGLPAPEGHGFGSTEFIVMRGSRAGPAFTYCLSRTRSFRDHARSSMSGASGRQRARTESVAAFELPVPLSDETLEQFETVAWPMLQQVGVSGEANLRLAASRDLLLPRLISGQLSVETAERELEAAA
nr:restriction endonuclease subunit S [Sphingomonas abaci]